MTRLKRKIVKDIYRGRITTLFSFLEKYIILKKPLPAGFRSEFDDITDNSKTRYFIIKDKDLANRKIYEFRKWYSFLTSNGYIEIEPFNFPFKIRFIYKSDYDDTYIEYAPFFSGIENKHIIPNKVRLKKYIKKGCRTSIEYKRYMKSLCNFILFKLIPLIAILLTLIITIYNTFFNNK